MRLSERKKRVLRAELRDLLFRLGVVIGVLLGFAWALGRTPDEPPASCASSAPTDSIGECVGQSFSAAAMPYVLGVGGGALVGALIGALLAVTLVRFGGTPQPKPAPPGGRWITARYAGSCAHCAGSIAPGDRIRHSPARALCASCASAG